MDTGRAAGSSTRRAARGETAVSRIKVLSDVVAQDPRSWREIGAPQVFPSLLPEGAKISKTPDFTALP